METQREKDIFLEGRGDFGVLLLHGFTAVPAQLAELAQQLCAQGYTVSVPLLPGHGAGAEGLYGVHWLDWVACARQEYTRLSQRCARVAVGGLSMGGALAALLAEEYPVEALLAYSPCILLKQKVAWAAQLARYVQPYAHNRDGERIFPLAMGYDLWRLSSRARLNAFAITAPVLIFQSVQDETIDPRGAKRLYDAVSSQKKEYVRLERSRHVCTNGPEKRQIFERSIAFLNGVRSASAAPEQASPEGAEA